MFRCKLNKNNKVNYITFLVFGVLCAAATIFCLIHPRGRYICYTLILFVGWFISFWQVRPTSRREIENPESDIEEKSEAGESEPVIIRKTFHVWYYILILGVIYFSCHICAVIFIFEVIFTKHMPWEYASEIARYKEWSQESYGFFPDELPEGAREVEWVVYSGFMQAKGYEYLSFVADEAYLQEYVDTYKDENAVWEEIHMVEEGELPVNLPYFIELSDAELESAQQYYLDGYDEDGGCWGFVIVRSNNRIIFYRQPY